MQDTKMAIVGQAPVIVSFTFFCIKLPYNGYFLRLEIFAIWVPKRSILISAFLIFAIPFNRKK